MTAPLKAPRDAKAVARKNRAVTRMIVLERLRQIVPIALIVVALAAVFIFRSVDLSHETGRHPGVIQSSNWKDDALVQKIFVSVKLDDGRLVEALGHFAAKPEKGATVEVSDRLSPFGTETFVVVATAGSHG